MLLSVSTTLLQPDDNQDLLDSPQEYESVFRSQVNRLTILSVS